MDGKLNGTAAGKGEQGVDVLHVLFDFLPSGYPTIRLGADRRRAIGRITKRQDERPARRHAQEHPKFLEILFDLLAGDFPAIRADAL